MCKRCLLSTTHVAGLLKTSRVISEKKFSRQQLLVANNSTTMHPRRCSPKRLQIKVADPWLVWPRKVESCSFFVDYRLKTSFCCSSSWLTADGVMALTNNGWSLIACPFWQTDARRDQWTKARTFLFSLSQSDCVWPLLLSGLTGWQAHTASASTDIFLRMGVALSCRLGGHKSPSTRSWEWPIWAQKRVKKAKTIRTSDCFRCHSRQTKHTLA